MKVLLLNPPSPKNYIRTGRWTRKSRANQSWYPIWLGYCTALLEREGYECNLLDAGTEGSNIYETDKKIEDFNPDHIAFYFGYSTRKQDLSYADKLGEKHNVILVGPWSYCLNPNELLNYSNLSLMTYGEFEHTVYDLLERNSPKDTEGLIYKQGKEVIRNDPRPLCSSKELDSIPFVTEVYDRFLNLRSYRQTSLRYPFIDMLGSRSCPYHCTFCLWVRALQHMSPKRYRQRSIANIIEELWWVKNNLPVVKQIWFQDDTLPPIYARKLSQAIIDEGLNICWGGYSRAEQDYETLKLMKKSGLRTLHVGYESADPEVLREIEKGITVEKMEEFAEYIHDLDLWTCAGFMIFPWQSKESVKNTIQWAKNKVKSRRFSFTQLFPYPRTPVCDTIEKYKRQDRKMLTNAEMIALEKEGFIENYLKNTWWLMDTLKHPQEWMNVLGDAWALLKFIGI